MASFSAGLQEAIWEQVDGDEKPAFLMVDGKIYQKKEITTAENPGKKT